VRARSGAAYQHPDHRQAAKVAVRATEITGIPRKLYFKGHGTSYWSRPTWTSRESSIANALDSTPTLVNSARRWPRSFPPTFSRAHSAWNPIFARSIRQAVPRPRTIYSLASAASVGRSRLVSRFGIVSALDAEYRDGVRGTSRPSQEFSRVACPPDMQPGGRGGCER
jgi:hypothetical protein